MSKDTRTAEQVMTEMQVAFFQENNPHKRGWITRKMEDLFTSVAYLETCYEIDYDHIDEEMIQ